MEMRAIEDIPISQDLLPPIYPLVISLHDLFLKSHCSSCFKILGSVSPLDPISCPNCNLISYCSLNCYKSDYDLHSSSSECSLLITQCPPSTCLPSSSLRAALRLLALGLPVTETRVGFLSVGSKLGPETWEGAELMRRVRKTRGRGEEYERVLGAVLTNAVEVHDSGGMSVGVGVYGLWFSWFNHSCTSNTSYRFEFGLESLDCWDLNSGMVRVLPESNGDEASEAWKTWVCGGNKTTQGFCRYGPRIIVRSIRVIKKDEEVCIAYTDLLQPKAMRHFDLWSKYHFVCSCERCSASPEMYVDYILNSDARSLAVNHDNFRHSTYDDLSEFLDQTVSDYISNGDPETCCTKLENMLSKFSKDSASQEPSRATFRLHPLHYLSLNAYIALSSACKMSNEEREFNKAFKMGRAAAAYSLLVAGATHHLFMSEPSLIASTAVFWINAGESVMSLLRTFFEVGRGSISHRSRFKSDGWKGTSTRFVKCILKKLSKSWPFLVQGLSYLSIYALQSDARSLAADHDNFRHSTYDDLSDFLDQTVSDYISNGDPETCCTKLESMLSKFSKDSASQEPSRATFRLHPLHYLSLNAYIALSSACKMSNEEREFNKAFKMGRAAAAYSLLLAGATHRLFMSEPSLIASAAVFWINAGESVMSLLRTFFEGGRGSISHRSRFKLDGCEETSTRFVKCILKKLSKSWPFLVQGSSYLENVENPVDFRWGGIGDCWEIEGGGIASDSCLCWECRIDVEMMSLEECRSLAELAVCCLCYGRYLSVICWGEHGYLVDKVDNLFCGGEQMLVVPDEEKSE